MTTPIIAPNRAEPVLGVLTADDLTPFLRTVRRGFHGDYDPDVWGHKAQLVEPDRAFGFRVGDRWVATCLAMGQTMKVPGGQLATAAVTYVTVTPGYRRQGLFRRMMTHQLTEIRDHGREALALLWATEGQIYGRFGYGLVAPSLTLSGRTEETAFLPRVPVPTGSVDEVDADVFATAVPALRARLTEGRPGALVRDERWWHYTLADPEPLRRGASALRFALRVGETGGLDGYASFRIRDNTTAAGRSREVEVVELEAADPVSAAALWRFVLDLDLVSTFTRPDAPTDDPLRWFVASQRAVHAELHDGPFARIVDVIRVLSGRSYAAPVDLVLEVSDPVLDNNRGRFRLQGGPDGASVGRVSGAADLSLSVSELASVFLGGHRAAALVGAGLITEHRSGAALQWDAAAGGVRAPFCDDHY